MLINSGFFIAYVLKFICIIKIIIIIKILKKIIDFLVTHGL